jgi:hypothetical protein
VCQIDPAAVEDSLHLLLEDVWVEIDVSVDAIRLDEMSVVPRF